VATVAAIAAFNASRQAPKPYPVFLSMIGIGLAMLTASWFTFDPDDTRPFLRFPGQGAPDYSASSYALFVFVWVCAWGYLALKQWQRRPPSVLTSVVFAVLIFGLAVILANFYYPQYRSSLDTIAGRLDAATSGLEFAALVIGLACILLGERAVLTWMLFATALLVASDMAYSEADVPSAIEPVWMLGQFLLLSALLILPGATEAIPPQSTTRSSLEEVAARQRSGSCPGKESLSEIFAIALTAPWSILFDYVRPNAASGNAATGLILVDRRGHQRTTALLYVPLGHAAHLQVRLT